MQLVIASRLELLPALLIFERTQNASYNGDPCAIGVASWKKPKGEDCGSATGR